MRNLNPATTENHEEDFQRRQRLEFKHLLQLDELLRGRPRKVVSERMGVSMASISGWVKEESMESMPAHWLKAWTKEVGPGALRFIANENGYDLVPFEDNGSLPVTGPGQLLALIAIHSGKLIGQSIQAREDGVIDDDERSVIYPAYLNLIHELQIEAENYKPVMGRRTA